VKVEVAISVDTDTTVSATVGHSTARLAPHSILQHQQQTDRPTHNTYRKTTSSISFHI